MGARRGSKRGPVAEAARGPSREGPGAFRLATDLTPQGDQPEAIAKLVEWIRAGVRHQVLLGVTGSGKTFTMAQVIAQVQRPTLVLAPNKTLAAQLFNEFRELFPENAVEYFVSYYDYYQPEAYIPRSDTYIEKDAQINDRIDRLRHAATHALVTRRDVIIVASVSCIYGLGSPGAYQSMGVTIEAGAPVDRDELLRALARIQYARNDVDVRRGTYRVRGDTLDIVPSYEEHRAIRVEWFGDTVEALREIDPLTGEVLQQLPRVTVHPRSHYVTPEEEMARALESIAAELAQRLHELRGAGKLLEAQRLEQRTKYDLEMLREVGACSGIENYSRHLDGRAPGEPPSTLFDFFPPDSLLIVDESHVSVPQLGGMYRGDRSRKDVLVEHGFRLPSAVDNRPLRFEEFTAKQPVTIYASATPAEWELQRAAEHVAEQVIRPTGLVDPEVEVRPARTQVQDLLGQIRPVIARGERVLVTTLTKRMAEDLTEFLGEAGVRVRYLHSDIDTLDRAEILHELRTGAFDVLVGINLLREGLDLPEVSLVAVLDADKEGFLRSERSLIQTAGRAARNLRGRVILYADHVTDAIGRAVAEMDRRRQRQAAWNAAHGITPRSVTKKVHDALRQLCEADYVDVAAETRAEYGGGRDVTRQIQELRQQMRDAVKDLRFEDAAGCRDAIRRLEALELGLDEPARVRGAGRRAGDPGVHPRTRRPGQPGAGGGDRSGLPAKRPQDRS